MHLPPPDPAERFSSPPHATLLQQPIVVFTTPPSTGKQALAGAILDARPGVLFVI